MCFKIPRARSKPSSSDPKEYAKSGIPWFDYYRDDLRPVDGSKILGGVKSVAQLGKAKGTAPLSDNTTIAPELIEARGLWVESEICP